MDKLIKTSEALKQLPISRATLVRLLQKGEIKGVQIGRNWFVYRSEVDRVKREGTR